MGIAKIRAVGLTATVFIILIFSILVVSYRFPISNSSESVGIKTTKFLWTYRLIDLIAQAFVLFAAAACCVAVLRTEEKE
jgi:hypothetical protein